MLLRHHVLARHRAESDESRVHLEEDEGAGCGGQPGKQELELGLESGLQPGSQRGTMAAEPKEAEGHQERHTANVFTGVGECVRQRQCVHGGCVARAARTPLADVEGRARARREQAVRERANSARSDKHQGSPTVLSCCHSGAQCRTFEDNRAEMARLRCRADHCTLSRFESAEASHLPP